MLDKTICIYHGNCVDGFGAAWVVKQAIPDCEFFAGFYGAAPPDVKGKDVYLVDFSYKRDVLLRMASEAKSITILDHHKTAESDLVDLPSNCYTVFDMRRSGAMIAWNFFVPSVAPPKLIEYIQDRDLWNFLLKDTREINSNLFSYPYDFDVWDKLMKMPIHDLAIEGKAIERKHNKDIRELLKVTQRHMVIAGVIVSCANLPYTMSSDACPLMYNESNSDTFTACYWDTLQGRTFSLRSPLSGMDVSLVAARYGGGGHKHAAGFSVDKSHPLASA